jgi:type VI secretion system secreted protein VgrG
MSLPLPAVATSEVTAATKTLPANSAHLRFAIAGNSYDAISFDGTEAISTPFSATLYVLVQLDSAWLGQPGLVTLTDSSGHERTLAGIVAYQRDRGLNANKQARVEILLRPRLWALSQTRDNRVFQGLSIPDIVTGVLKQHDINGALWHLSQTYAPLPYNVQFQETDLEYVERLLSEIGVSYWFTVKDGKDILNFTDDNAKFTSLDLGKIPFIANAGLDKPQASFNKFIKGIRNVPANVQIVDFNPMTPDNVIKAGDGPAANDPAQVHYGLGTNGPDEAELRSRIINERHALEGLRIEIFGSAAGLHPGAVFSFEHPKIEKYSGDYLVMSLTHTLIQQAAVEHESDLGNLAYTQHAQLIPRTVPYRPELKPAQVLPTVYSAHIESNGTYALLDEHGRFKMRKLYDTRDSEDAAHTEAGIPMRSLSFHGGPGSDNTVGAAFPYRDGVEVLWASVDGDPSRPIILGCLTDPSNLSPVTSNNYGDNIIRTKGKNELVMHDIKGEEHIELKQGDYDKPFNLMRLDANSAGHSVKFATTFGAMQVYAKQTMKTEAGDSITQTHGNDRTETVENSHSLTTKNKDILYQSATDQTHSAQDNITHKADKNIEHKSAETTQWRVSRNSVITIKQGDQIIKIDNGSLKIQAAKAINIKGTGSGSIKIGQNGGGLEIDAGGNVKLYGKAVTISGGSGVKLKGQVSYGAGSGSLSASALAPLAVSEMPKLADTGGPTVTELAFKPAVVPVGTSSNLLFYTKHFQGGETAKITVYKYPDGDESRRTVVDTLTATLPDSTGQIEVPWTASADSASRDTAAQDGESVIKGPDEFRFEVKVDGTSSDQASAPLWLTHDYDIDAQESDGAPMKDGTEVHIKQANGESRYAKVADGKAHFTQIVMGYIETKLSDTTHSKEA